MYAVIAIGLMIVIPAISIAIEFSVAHSPASVFLLIGKWFTFWGIGVRLLIAGLNQILRPEFTAKGIFNISDPAAQTIVTELGNANLAFGVTGLLSLFWPAQFLVPAAVAGSIFLALDGILHLRSRDRGTNETIALVTDLVVPIAVVVYLSGEYLMRF